MSKEIDPKMLKKGIYTGILEQDENNNFFCGEFLLDYKVAASNFKLGDVITIKTVIENPSDISYNKYPKKSRNFDKANMKPEQ
ncbi:hypothetical protein ACRASX_13390 [Flavobacterium sp. TMP13]|uniref:hypothetical protein n=1 Tax=unclassified Flavobacterium TaxID=196869 RepID=UPI00076D8D51|nr:hypothetical protein [Flavobacterium sp. TAB 87]KVV14655.1 hypothetical protein AP058_01708 [Flavobacterium sp. TAB 87]